MVRCCSDALRSAVFFITKVSECGEVYNYLSVNRMSTPELSDRLTEICFHLTDALEVKVRMLP